MSKKLLKITETNCTIKAWGSGITETISLATDLKRTTETLVGSQIANISAITWFTASQTDRIDILRNGELVMTLNGCGQFDMNGSFTISDDSNHSSDVVVTVFGTGGVYLGLRKVSGYASHIEPEYFGSYDNQTVAGA